MNLIIKKILKRYFLFFKDNFNLTKDRFRIGFEVFKINRYIKKRKNIFIVYDHLSSPLTYGDFLYVVYLCRFFLIHDLKVTLILIDGEYREDHKKFVESTSKQFLAEQSDLAFFISGEYSSNFAVSKIEWKEFYVLFTSVLKNKENILLFENKILSRKPIYQNIFNLLNYLIFKLDDSLKNKFLLEKNKFPKPELSNTIEPYIVFNVRFNSNWGLDRNTDDSTFVQISKQIINDNPGKSLVVVSSDEGCKHFSVIAEKSNLNCYFSMDLKLNKNFISDVLIVLNASKYIQIMGGGLLVIPLFSKIPYFIQIPPIHERMWGKNKLTSWQTSEQYFIPDKFILNDIINFD